jgi:hypothetical protein
LGNKRLAKILIGQDRGTVETTAGCKRGRRDMRLCVMQPEHRTNSAGNPGQSPVKNPDRNILWHSSRCDGG